jgi:hypothetical protein
MTDDPAARLADILTRENEALARVNYAAAVAIAVDKEAALADMAKGPPPPAPRLQHLSELAHANRELLERAIAVQTRVVRIVAQACAPPPATTPYSRHRGKPARSPTAAMALSTRA